MITKSEDAVNTACIDVQPPKPHGDVVAEVFPETADVTDIEKPSIGDAATHLARQALKENTWEAARAVLLRAMQLLRELERDQREKDQQHPRGEGWFWSFNC